MRHYPEPNGSITKFGYRRFVLKNRRQKFEHVLVWEKVNGPVPVGKELHHVNGDKLDNRIANLRLVSRLEHKRIHSGCELRDGVWWKQCRECSTWKPVDDFYQYPGRNGVMGACKPCCVQLATDYKRIRKQRLRMSKMLAACGGTKNAPLPAPDKQIRNGESYRPQETPANAGVTGENA